MMQRLGPAHVGDDTYRIVEATMMNNAKRITGYDWYAAAGHTGTDIPTKMEMRNYGRECALAYILEGDTITAAVAKAIKHVYHRAYDDAKGDIKHVGGGRDRAMAVSSLVDTNMVILDDRSTDGLATGMRAAYLKLQYLDNHRWFETADLIARLDLPAEEKQILTYIALGYTTKDIAAEIGVKRTTLAMRLPKIMERIREQCRTALKAL